MHLELIHRCHYFGATLCGTPRKNLQAHLPRALRGQGSITVKVLSVRGQVSHHGSLPFQECCFTKHNHRRVVLDESNFLDAAHHHHHPHCGEEWNLFVLQQQSTDHHYPHHCERHDHNNSSRSMVQLILVPKQQQASVDNHNKQQKKNHANHQSTNVINVWSGWTFLGTCRASALRMDLDYHLGSIDISNADGCIHMEVFVPSFFDRHYRESQKVHHRNQNHKTNKPPQSRRHRGRPALAALPHHSTTTTTNQTKNRANHKTAQKINKNNNDSKADCYEDTIEE